MKILVIISTLVFCTLFAACKKAPRFLGEDIAAQRLDEVLNDSTHVLLGGDTLVKTERTAILMGLAVAFRVYGEDMIREEAPYWAHLVNGYWMVGGTLPRGMKGGVFEVIISAKDGRVLNVIHFK